MMSWTCDLGTLAASALVVLSQAGGPLPTSTDSFSTHVSLAVGVAVHSIDAIDIDADGYVDLVAAVSPADAVAVFRGTGDGFEEFVMYATGASPKHVAIADLDADGVLDIVVANQDSEHGEDVTVLLGLASGGFSATEHYPACKHPHQVATGQFDGDTRVDVVVACWGQQDVAILPNLGAGRLGPIVFHRSGADPHAVVSADFDGDGHDDVAVANLGASTVGLLMGRGGLDFAPVVTFDVGSSPHDLDVADLNADGCLDLVTANQGSDDVSVLLGTCDGGFVVASFPAGASPKGVATGDTNGDGIVDVVTANSHGNYPDGTTPTDVSVLIGLGQGRFDAPEHEPLSGTPFAVAVHDVDGDGREDVLVARWHAEDVVVLRNARSASGGDMPTDGLLR